MIEDNCVSPLAVEASADTAQFRLTVVIPHYNHIAFLPRAIASALDQEFEGLEIVVVDDGSEPACQAVLDHLAATQPAVRVIRHAANRGAPAALNSGLAAARGAMVSFLGADDLVLPGAYASMFAALERYPQASFACGGIVIVGDDGCLRGVRPIMAPTLRGGYLSPSLLKRRIRTTDNWISNTVTVYRTEVLRRAGGFDESLGAFCDGLVVRCLAFETGFVFVPGLFGAWRVAADTLSASSVLQVENATAFIQLVVERLSASSVAQAVPDYPEIYSRRLRFGAARLHLIWHEHEADPEIVCALAGLGESHLRALSVIKRTVGFRGLGRTLALACLTVWLRPYGPFRFGMHMARNVYFLWRHRGRVTTSIAQAETRGRALTRVGKTE
jgi:glycosyltransferase involved in cell wall biosynthesis